MGTYSVEYCYTFVAVAFRGDSANENVVSAGGSYWTKTDATDAPAVESPPTLLKDLGLYTQSPAAIEPASWVPTPGVWGALTDFRLGAVFPYTASRGSGTVEASGLPDYVGRTRINHAVDNLSVRFFESCNLAREIEHLVVWQPDLLVAIDFGEANVVSYLVHGDNTTTNNVDVSAKTNANNQIAYHGVGTRTSSGVDSSAQLLDSLALVYKVVKVSIGDFEYDWTLTSASGTSSSKSLK